MKASIFALTALFAASTAMAQSNSAASNTSSTNSTSAAQNAGNSQALALNSYAPADQTLRSAPTVYAPAMPGSFAQQNCMVAVSGGFSIVGLGASGGAPVDGKRCDWRLNKQGVQATAMTLTNFASTAGLDAATRAKLIDKARAMLNASADMDCLADDRQRMVLEKQGLCASVADVATLDHRFNQPRSTQVDYSQAK